MRELDLGRHRRACLWIGSLPAAQYESLETVSAHVPGYASVQATVGAVEVYVPLGARFAYGLLGGRLSPYAGSQLRLLAKLSSQDGPRFNSAICPLDDLRVGLPSAFAESIQAGIETSTLQIRSETMASADLVIDCAAHGQLGSSLAIFTHLTAILVKMLTTVPASASDEELIKLFPETYF